ncbi:MAG: NAD(P)/FAD-dependent oxidoreductase [Thermoguttaceae bacterium]|nr:NAD(P)/FAD-dependent oxidoreductase [Thermoguttaceae bacterium]MDW8036741.1 NAD(P)/FAD-dependent oxidoreductase [Thermoguttaceae bacterium]
MREVETIIVGGGPAGSSCAWQLVRHGHPCLVLEKQPMPRPKLCAGWIPPKVLADLEILPNQYPHELLRLDRLRLVVGRTRRWSFRIRSHQYAIHRTDFDAWLLQRSRAEVLHHTVRRIQYVEGRYILDEEFSCKNLVGAGGTSCPVRRNLFPPHQGNLILTREAEYPAEPNCKESILWFPFAGQSGYAWYIPKRGVITIGFGGLAKEISPRSLPILWNEFIKLLEKENCWREHLPLVPRGHPYFLSPLDSVVKHHRAYLIGDAAGLATWDLAEGIGPAIESGILAARDILGMDTYHRNRIRRYSLGLLGRFFRWIWASLP